MKKGCLSLFSAISFIPAALPAQPAIGQNGVVNRASQIPPTLAAGALARGAAFTIHGVHFGSAARLTLEKDKVAMPVRVLKIEPEKIEAVLPDAAPLGPAALTVTADGASSKAFPLTIVSSNPGIYSLNGTGWGPGRIETLDAAGKRALNSTSNPAHPGQMAIARITGLGRQASTRIVIGNRETEAKLVQTDVRTGQQEVSFVIPSGAPSGCYVPVYFLTALARASNVVTMAIHSGDGKCDPGPILVPDGKRAAIAVLTRADMLKSGMATTTDDAIVLLNVKSDGPSLSPLMLVPPPGSCTSYTSSFQASTVVPDSLPAAIVAQVEGNGLDAGRQLTLTREKENETGRRIIPVVRGSIGYYRARLGSSRPGIRSGPPLFLDPGALFFNGPGGIDVGPFHSPVDGPTPFEWTNREQTPIVKRDRPLTLTWRGQTIGHLTVILATNVDQITTAIGTCLCTAPLNASQFEVPAAFLANIPASVDLPGVPYDQLYVASIPAKAKERIDAAGLEASQVLTIFATGRFVGYQ